MHSSASAFRFGILLYFGLSLLTTRRSVHGLILGDVERKLTGGGWEVELM